MAEHIVTLTEEQEAAGLALMGSVEAVEAELQVIVNYTASPWVAKANADKAAAEAASAAEMATKYAKLEKSDQEAVDALLSKADAAVEEPTP